MSDCVWCQSRLVVRDRLSSVALLHKPGEFRYGRTSEGCLIELDSKEILNFIDGTGP